MVYLRRAVVSQSLLERRDGSVVSDGARGWRIFASNVSFLDHATLRETRNRGEEVAPSRPRRDARSSRDAFARVVTNRVFSQMVGRLGNNAETRRVDYVKNTDKYGGIVGIRKVETLSDEFSERTNERMTSVGCTSAH